MSKKIERLVRSIASKKAKIDLTKYKILQHTKECNARNQALKKEKENICQKLLRFEIKNEQIQRGTIEIIKELVNNSRNDDLKLTEYKELGEKILKTAELFRKLETEREKVLPFDEDNIDLDQIPENLKNDFEAIEKEQYEEFAYLNNFYKRYDKVLLDILAIQKQKEALQNESNQLQSYSNNIWMDYLVMMMFYQIQIHYLLKISKQIQVKNNQQVRLNKQQSKECLMVKGWTILMIILLKYMNQKLDNLRQFKIPRSISNTNQKQTLKKLNHQSMLNIVDKLPSIQKQHVKRIQTEIQQEDCFIQVAAKTLPGQNLKKKLKINQDSLAIKQNLCNQNDWHLFGIFDGHGQNGHLVSQFLSKQLPKTIEYLLMQNYVNNPNQLSQSIQKAFQQVENDLVDKTNISCNFSGSTAVVILLIESRIYCANVGDSRAVYFYKFQDLWYNRPLSYDHKPNKTFELKRIIRFGGRVEQSLIDGKKQGPFRVWLTNEDVPGLAMSRSFGDVAAKSVGVISEPEILRYKIQNSGFILLASDGLWDKMDFDSIQKILDHLDPPITQLDMEQVVQKILGETYSKWDRKDSGRDDITLILVHVQI